MKNLIIITLMFVAAIANGQSVTIYFDASSYEVSTVAEMAINEIPANATIDSVVGYANTLRNLNGMSNIELATLRAQEVSAYVDFIPGNVYVRGTTALDRKVVIYYHIENVKFTTVEDNINDYAIVDTNDITNHNAFNNTDITDNIDDNATSNGVDSTSIVMTYADTTKFTQYELDVFNQPLVNSNIEDKGSCGCGVNNSLEQTWELYKAYQDSSRWYTHIDNERRNMYDAWATQVRICWESMLKQYRYQQKHPVKQEENKIEIPKGGMHMEAVPPSLTPKNDNDEAFNNQKADGFSIAKAAHFNSVTLSPDEVGNVSIKPIESLKTKNNKSTKKNRKVKRVRRPRTWRPNDNIWSKLFPFRAC